MKGHFSFEFAKIHARLDKMTEAISKLGIQNIENSEDVSVSLNEFRNLFPIGNEDDLEKLDNLLRNKKAMEIFVDDMSKYNGKKGNLVGNKVALNMIDKWFHRSFLIKCSWTGSTKTKGKNVAEDEVSKKINFSSYKRVIESFFKHILFADNRYSLKETEEFKKKTIAQRTKSFESIATENKLLENA